MKINSPVTLYQKVDNERFNHFIAGVPNGIEIHCLKIEEHCSL